MTALPSMQTPRHPDEECAMADDLTHAEKLWCVRRCCPDWALYYDTVDEAFTALEHRPEMDKLIAEIDADNAEVARLDCSDLGEWLEAIAMTPVLLRRQAGDRR